MRVTKRFVRESMHVKKYDIFVELLIAIGIGGLVTLGFTTYQNSIEANRSERAEMLADVAYIRETLRDGGPKLFHNMNLRDANLSGLDLGCDIAFLHNGVPTPGGPSANDDVDTAGDEHCADFYGSDFTGADLSGADFTGAQMNRVNFAPGHTEDIILTAAELSGAIDVLIARADLRGATLAGAFLPHEHQAEDSSALIVQSDLRGARFRIEEHANLTVSIASSDISAVHFDQGVDGHLGNCEIPVSDECAPQRGLTGAGAGVRASGGLHFPHRLQQAFNEYWSER
ncbi:pentapeptide repeat-containing protein [Promicromonospora sp. NPDC050249]|uniref:pentapeptide repeat-containing protein n=1 Tax=Promicromonospora sp. NPDC050249 TaxID=3154743 RepID=UPI0033DE00B8